MTAILHRPATQDGLFLWIMHRFAEVFESHAILKGGMVLRLLDSPRLTNDIDYVFVPYTSKKEIVEQIRSVLSEVDGAVFEITFHSKMLRADLNVDGATIQIEGSVALACETSPMATAGFARAVGHPSQIVRAMSLAHALAYKIAAWNERRLWRDLFDVYFLATHAGARIDLGVLDARLAHVSSRLPRRRRVRSMSRAELIDELRHAVLDIGDDVLARELAGVLPAEELAGLAQRLRVMVERLVRDLL